MFAKEVFVILLPYFILRLGSCCDVNTFNNNSVILVGAKSVKTITGCFEPNDKLIKVSYIQLVNQTLPVLRTGAINGLPNLEDVVLENDLITDIEPGAFHNLPKLYLIKIKYNNVRVLRDGVFNGLTLKELCLTDNNIELIHPNAFNDMPNLNILFLNENKIVTLSNSWFKRSPQVSVLNFENNYITTIPFQCFQNIYGEHIVENIKIGTNIQLNNNKIRKIEDGAFDGLETLGWLFLHRNEIEDISEESLGSMKSIEWVRLDSNNLTCVPEKLVKISPKIIYYLYANPLSEECRNKFTITVAR